ncbi:hypothetical protein NQ318_022414 [Aromia moschata]|uniref:COX assembly mitochondrial protein n=1 Tax=Aromia moschata TaxID=1265417 RepID=A0AAV8Z6P5_9CUCU|nr:hypothetical protein NQ318_022414 [Aromia moschata]
MRRSKQQFRNTCGYRDCAIGEYNQQWKHIDYIFLYKMPTDLSPNLHTEKCNELIELLKQCRSDHPFRKFFGICNSAYHQMTKCLKEERLARRARNFEKSIEMKRKWKEMSEESQE